MKRPLLMVGLLYAAGICLAQWAQLPLLGLFALSIAVGVLAILWSRGRTVLLCSLLPLAGWANYTARVAVLAPDDLRVLFASGPEQINLRGRIRIQPIAKIFTRDGNESWRSSATIETSSVQRGANWTSACGTVIATSPGLLNSNYFAGREVTIHGVIQSPRGPLAPGLFDARRFYANQGIYFQLVAASTNDWRLTPGVESMPLSTRFDAWARRTLALGLPEEDEPLRLMWTLALDWKTSLTPDIQEPFLQAGTYHIFAVDGLRIGLLAGICMALLRAMQIPRALCGAIVIPLIWAYAGFTGWPASAVRATIMMTIVVLGWALRRPADLMNSLFAAAFIILCWDPRQLFAAGFQLSFVIVFCIAILLPPARALVYDRLFGPDPLLAPSLRKRPPDWLVKAVRYVGDMLLLSWTAWLASLPLAAYYFHLFTPWSVPANFFVVPLTALALMSCAGSLLFGAFLPGISVLFNNATWFFMKSIIVVSQHWAGWRPHSLNMSAPSLVAMEWYYLVVLSLASGWIFRTKLKRLAWAGIAAATILAALDWNIERATARLTVLPLGGGSAVFIDKPHALLDCGNQFFAEHETKPFLQAQGVNHLRAFALTTPLLHQSGGAEIIRTNFSVAQFAPAGKLHVGDSFPTSAVLSPPPTEKHARADDNALVLQTHLSTWTVLLLSTLGREGQDGLLNRAQSLRSDIIIAGLPEADEPLCEPLLAAIQPKIIVVTDSAMPATRRAADALRDRLGRHSARVFYCRDVGALTIAACESKITITDATGEVLLTTTH